MGEQIFSLTESEKPPSARGEAYTKSVAQQQALHHAVLIPPYEPPSEDTTECFKKKYYPQVKDHEWNDWKWQIRHRLTSYDDFNRIFRLSEQERSALQYKSSHFPYAVTPYYASRIDPLSPNDPVRRTVIPGIHEAEQKIGESPDPLAEQSQCPVDGIVHRYPDRVLFLATSFCSTYCRYCTRSRIIDPDPFVQRTMEKTWRAGLAYIEANKQIRDVLISGGDPLTLGDDALEWLCIRLRAIKHVEIIRIGTKVPAVLPQRITTSLVNILKQFHPLFMSLHFTHPREITPEVTHACSVLADAGIPLGSQTVLLSGINDTPEVLKRLFQKLLTIRVRPYYLYQCDHVIGSSSFRTSVQRGIDIMKQLHGFTSGYALPRYVIDAPGGGGKICVNEENIVSRVNDTVCLRNYSGDLYYYPDTGN